MLEDGVCRADPRLLAAGLGSNDLHVLLVLLGVVRSMTSDGSTRHTVAQGTIRLMDERLKVFIEAGVCANLLAVLATERREQWMHAPKAVTKKPALRDAHLLNVGITIDMFLLLLADLCGDPFVCARIKRVACARDVSLFAVALLRGQPTIHPGKSRYVAEAASLFLLNMSVPPKKRNDGEHESPVLRVLTCSELSSSLVAGLKVADLPDVSNNTLCTLFNLQYCTAWLDHIQSLPLFVELLTLTHASMIRYMSSSVKVVSAASDFLAALIRDAPASLHEAISKWVHALTSKEVLDVLALMRHDQGMISSTGLRLIGSLCVLRESSICSHGMLRGVTLIHDIEEPEEMAFQYLTLSVPSVGCPRKMFGIKVEPEIEQLAIARAVQLKWTANERSGLSLAQAKTLEVAGIEEVGHRKTGLLMEGNRCFNPFCEANACVDETPSAKKLLRCASCLQAWYCSQECQVADWKRHKKACKRVVAERAAAAADR